MANPADQLREAVARALAEDLGSGDVTAEATVPAEARGRARIVQKQAGVVFGLDAVVETMRQCGVEQIDVLLGPEASGKGTQVGAPGDAGTASPEDRAQLGRWRPDVPAEVLVAHGPARALLAAERTALNFLVHLSGVATLTARFVAALAGTGAQVLDTRKTTPGLRGLEKAAVAAGGGRNHRMGLYDAFLIKENHIALAGGLAAAVQAARAARPELPVEVECRDLDEVTAGLRAGADTLLLDNMDLATLRGAVELRDREAGGEAGPSLEASGGVDLESVRAIAETGVEFISIGALTHSAPGLDFSMLIEPV